MGAIVFAWTSRSPATTDTGVLTKGGDCVAGRWSTGMHLEKIHLEKTGVSPEFSSVPPEAPVQELEELKEQEKQTEETDGDDQTEETGGHEQTEQRGGEEQTDHTDQKEKTDQKEQKEQKEDQTQHKEDPAGSAVRELKNADIRGSPLALQPHSLLLCGDFS